MGTERAKAAAPPKAPRLRDAERTREQIIQVAIEEFSQKGFDGARVERIARGSNVNMRMIYHYYENKEMLYVAVLERVYRDVRTAENDLRIDDLPPLEAVRTLIEFTFEHFQRHPELVNLVMGENLLGARYLKKSEMVPRLTVRLREQVAKTLERGVAEGVFRRNVDAGQFWFTVFSLCWVPVANRHTMSWTLQCDLSDRGWIEARKAHIVDVLICFLVSGEEMARRDPAGGG